MVFLIYHLLCVLEDGGGGGGGGGLPEYARMRRNDTRIKQNKPGEHQSGSDLH